MGKKKTPSSEDATGDINPAALAEVNSGQPKWMSVLEKQLPVLYKIVSKFKKKDTHFAPEIETEETQGEIEVGVTPKADEKTHKDLQAPASKVATEDKTGDIPVENAAQGKAYFSEVDEAAPPKKKFKINIKHVIAIVIILGVILFGNEEEKKDEKAPAPEAAVTAAKPAEKPAEAKPTEAKPDEPKTVEATPEAETPVEKTEEPAPPTDTATTEATPAEKPVTDEASTEPEIVNVESTPTEVATTPEVSESEVNPEPAPEETPKDSPEIVMTGEEQGGDDTGEEKTSEDLTSDILENLEKKVTQESGSVEKKLDYVAPPDYENLGRGLVYNCLGKHWACIDAASFSVCQKNSASIASLGKKTECHPANIFESMNDCAQMQKHNIHSLAKTEFCN